ncbi:MAG: 30S ribosomal protein S6 [Desulfobulbaceae bacterium]|nr:30S ribosomal protein S6 [Desulfobulbaceae bacterium]
MRRYETISIIRPNIGEDEVKAISQKTADIIEGEGGTILNVDNWGLKKLAYPIKKEMQGYYVYTVFAGLPSSVMEMERIFRIDDRLLKYMTVKLQDVYVPDPEVEESEAEISSPESEETSETVEN